MKKIATLVLFFCLSFISVLVAASLAALLEEWTGQALLFPPGSGNIFAGNVFFYLERYIPFAFYAAILLGLSYSARRRIAYPAAFAIMLVFSVVLSGVSYMGLESMGSALNITMKIPQSGLVKPGFILNTSSGGFQTVFLTDPYQNGARISAIQGRPLSYQKQGSFPAQTLPFGEKKSSFFDGINRNIEQSALVFSAWFKAGILAYGVYTGALAAFLLSLGCLVNISFWFLANLFFAALAFRGALALEFFLNQPGIHRLLVSFAGTIVPEPLINPLIFAALGVLVLFYSGLVYLARGKIDG